MQQKKEKGLEDHIIVGRRRDKLHFEKQEVQWFEKVKSSGQFF